MTLKLDMLDLSIGDLFTRGLTFAIPHYQREYAWETEHAQRLFDDIYAAMVEHQRVPASNPYFLGSVLVCAADPSAVPSQRLDIVDGQQRFITLTMLFACLRDSHKGAAARELSDLITAKVGPTLLLRPADIAYFEEIVQKPGATRTSPPRLTEEASSSHRNIRENRNLLRRLIISLDQTVRDAFTRYMLDQCRVVIMRSADVDYAHQIFLSINERGKELSVEDIFQAELLGPLDRAAQERYAPIVGHVGKYKRENQKNVGRGKTFFSHIAIAYGWPNRGIVKSIREQIRRYGGPAEFTRHVFRPMADAYLELSGLVPLTRPLAEEGLTALANLHMLEVHGDDDWLATAMLAWTMIEDNSELAEVLVQIDRLAHIQLALGFGGGARKKRYADIHAAFLAKKPLADILAMMMLPISEERAALRNVAQKFHIIDKASCRLFLLRIDQQLTGRPQSYYHALDGFPLGGPTSFSIEHLLPKGETLKLDGRDAWEALFPDAGHRQVCAQYLGNLALVPEVENKKMDQKSFADKKAIMLGATPHPLALTEALREAADWDLDMLKARHEMLMNAVKEIWSLRGRYPEPPAPRKPKTTDAATPHPVGQKVVDQMD